jgi:hypothetical protein
MFTASDVEAADKLYDILNRMQESTQSILGVVSTNAVIPGNILRGVTFTAGQVINLVHGLEREWQGYFVVKSTGAADLSNTAYPPGQGADTILPLVSANAGTYDIYVF